MVDSIKNWWNSFYNPKVEDFYKFGYLSPEQFVMGGDQLTLTGWKWEGEISGKKNKSLPDSKKQFLRAEASSERRIKDIMGEKAQEKEEDGWVIAVSEKTSQQKEEDTSSPRIYKLTITYDEYYHTPRLWLEGFNEQGAPLSEKEVFEDIMSEYQNETVTFMEHPYLGVRQVSIHPCKHSEVMKNLINMAESNGVKILPHQALQVFLKFMLSVMPTIVYDFTVNISFG